MSEKSLYFKVYYPLRENGESLENHRIISRLKENTLLTNNSSHLDRSCLFFKSVLKEILEIMFKKQVQKEVSGFRQTFLNVQPPIYTVKSVQLMHMSD